MIEIQVLNKTTTAHPNWIIDSYLIIPPIPRTSFTNLAGTDPGSVNLGLCWTYITDNGEDRAYISQIKITRLVDPVDRVLLTREIVGEWAGCHRIQQMTIENAAFAQGFRQAELAEQRAVITLWCIEKGIFVQMIVPNQIRKAVFGSGKIKAHEAWQLAGIPKNKQPNDALAALSCAYYGMMKGSE